MLVLIMAAYIYTVLRTYPTPTRTVITRLNQGPCLNLSLRNLFHLLAASVLQVPKPMDVPFNPSTSCQGAHHVFVVFSTIQLAVGLCCRGVRGAYRAVERRHAAPAVVGRLGLVLDTEFGFWASRRRRRNRAPPLKPPWFFEQETATELGSRFPFICGFK